GIVAADPEPAFYIYRMGFRDTGGRPRQTSGVIGALELAPIGAGDILPHERTMAKALGDRLELLRACQVNLSPIWGITLATGLGPLCDASGSPAARCTDEQGVHHRLWPVTGAGAIEAIAAAVASAPVVIADGHHRFETALAYRDERRAAAGDQPGPYDLVMAYLVEAIDDEVAVGPTHRLVSGLDGPGLPTLLGPQFELEALDPGAGESLPDRMAAAGALALVTRTGRWLLYPRSDESEGVDAEHFDRARASLPPHQLAYEHDWRRAVAAVGQGDADAAVLLRPATVAQIAATGRAGGRMPEKTTYFYPKLRTGLVFRSVRS
ncbi:MAG: DUF1015 family protein, partial [Acidimicrobiales bacterium]